MSALFVTGTDTGVGKTRVSALLTRAWREAGIDVVALKPICCGPREDAEILESANGGCLAIDEVNPCWLAAPAAPSVAAAQEGLELDWVPFRAWTHRLEARHRHLLIEGAGGWLVPVNERETLADWAKLWDAPVLIVVANRLGCLNHTLLTLESLHRRGVACAGIVLNRTSPAPEPTARTNASRLAREAPVLLEVGFGQESIDRWTAVRLWESLHPLRALDEPVAPLSNPAT